MHKKSLDEIKYNRQCSRLIKQINSCFSALIISEIDYKTFIYHI